MSETRNSSLWGKITVLLIICFFSISAQGKYGGGTGEPNDPYLIYTAEQMNAIGADSNDWDKHFKLMADIDLSAYTGTAFNIIGYFRNWQDSKQFSGVFDGNGHTISNFTYTSTETSYIGLFSYVEDPNAEIKDLGLIAPDIDAGTGSVVGSLIGYLRKGTITGCYVEGGRVSENWNVGGLVGVNSWAGRITNCYAEGGNLAGDYYIGGLVGSNYGTITNCYSTGNVLGNKLVGGLVGYNDGTITDCYSDCGVTGQSSGGLVGLNYGDIIHCQSSSTIWLEYGTETAGGLVGYNWGTISNCFATGKASGGENAGGLAGKNYGQIANCYATGYVTGSFHIGGLVGWNCYGTISNCYSTGSVAGDDRVGGLVGINSAKITNCYSSASVTGENVVAGLVGYNGSTITNCDSVGDVLGFDSVGGLVGDNSGTITDCYAKGSVTGKDVAGGLVGRNLEGTITNSYSKASVLVTGWNVGGLVGLNDEGTIAGCYAAGSASGASYVGGLVGFNFSYSTITNCYATGNVEGNTFVGGLVGDSSGDDYASFWDIETGGPDNGIGTPLPTEQMKMASTFTDAGWDFATPIWTIDEGVDYPRLWWELVPMLHAEPEVTLGTSNTISWEPLVGDVEYYAECAEDANFTRIIYNSGWITETSCEFTGLELGKRYWYSVKVRNAAGIESQWSNVESSLQCTLADAVEIELEPESLKNEKMKNALLNKIDAAMKMIEETNYTGALSKLEHDILAKMDGCGETGQPDKNDWIITCEEQSEVYPLIIDTIEHVKGLME
ncbi:MAG TPA: GLUG motif-containing protein [Sedimentisphaerales bacterium]|nr:GLUG motif-containing protein [Sedimentisphaerales bacterium]